MRSLEALDLFLVYKKAENLSDRTIQFYQDQCQRFIDYVENGRLGSLSPIAIATYLSYESARGLSPSSCAAAWRALNAWFNWCVEQDLIRESPIGTREKKRVKCPRTGRPLIRYVTLAEYERLAASIDGEHWLDYRDRAILQVLFWSGLRLSECADLQIGDVDFDRRLITVRSGKGNEARFVPFLPGLENELATYYEYSPGRYGSRLWLASDGYEGIKGPLAPEGVRQMVRRRCERAGMRIIHPHAFRHGFAMTVLNAGADMSAVSDMLGHSSEEVTATIYAHWLTEGLQREYNEALSALGQLG